MKNLLLTIAIILVLAAQAFGRKIPGIIITKGETRQVTFDIKVPFLDNEPNFVRIQNKVKYYDESGKKQVLRPEDADEIIFDFEGMEVRMISCANNLGRADIFSSSKRIFLKLEIDGPLRLYRHYYKQTSPGTYAGPGMGYSGGMTYTVENFIFQKGDGPLKQPRSLGWRKDMLQYFSDCPALRGLIDTKDFRRKEVEAIVMFYNRNCGKD